ncbi:DNA polymerase III subunit delta [Enterococcus canis]|uniref:DNA polymerase III subunit delta n=1 Tax=Enterococcus canis TaxID=214095 RepID=A0A1L8RGY3_9ENTE|nr:DNA polymerase III subunit delta' [Enterococcus canis]OJG19026.1 DNA polymerase III subunit delta [Enterococcus canis]
MNEAETLAALQPIVYTQLHHSILEKRVSHAYLFEGQAGTGKHEFALWLAKSRFCTALVDGNPCNQCHNCTRINEGEHPDVHVIEPDGQSIKVDQIRELKTAFSKSGVETKRQVFLIRDAEKMSTGAANSLLKFLEEPDGEILAVLETESASQLLPTIRSRCQYIFFHALSESEMTRRLGAKGVGPQSAQLLAQLTNSLEKAVELSQDEWFNEAKDTMRQWFTFLTQKDLQAFVYVQKKLVKVFKEKSQQELAFDLLLAFYRQTVRRQTQTEVEAVLTAQQKWHSNVAFQAVLEQLALRIVLPQE